MSSQKKQPAKVIELSGEDILALVGDAKGQEERNLSVEAIREEILDYPNSILLAGFFKAFGDGTRLRILNALSIRDLCVKELCQLLDASQPAVSNHLRILSQQQMVKPIRRGKNIYYSLGDWHINAIIGVALERFALDGSGKL